VESDESTVNTDAPPEAPKPQSRRGTKSFDLGPDNRGATINGVLYAVYAAVSVYVAAVVAEPNSTWFYVFYFLFFLAAFQGFTVVARHCLHLTPKAPVRIEIEGKKVRLTTRKGDQLDLTRDLDYTRRKDILVLQGRTHDNQKVSEVIRKGALGEEAFEALITALKRVR